MMIFITIIITILVIILLYMIFSTITSSHPTYTPPSLHGGNRARFAHVLDKIDIADIATQFEVIKNAPENYLEMVKIFVRNALYDYETVTKNAISDSQISYVNQGFNNIVVRFGNQLLRIRKFIRKNMFKHDYILTTQLKQYSKSNHLNVLVPYQYHRNESSDDHDWFIYWTIPELTEIVEPFNYDKIRQTITTIADFLNRDGNTFTYIDFKRENFMLNKRGEYILADFDFTYALDLKMVMKNHKYPPVTDEVLDSIVGNKVKYYSDYELIRYPIAATYFGVKKDENGVDMIDWDNIGEGYDTKILVAMLVIRMFMIHMRRDSVNNQSLDYLELTKDDVQKMITMKSTRTADVLDAV